MSRRGTLETRESIRQAFNDGTSLMSYLGHGAIHLWAEEDLFNINTVDTLILKRDNPYC